MKIIYNFAIQGYYLFVLLFSIWNEKAAKWIDGRKNWEEKLKGKLQPNRPVVWVHCSSLGEFEQGRPVIEKIKKETPNHQILLTFFSPSGYEVRKDYECADVVMYLPLDTKKNARKFINLVNPAKAIFVKYEFWYHILNELKKNDIPTYLISAIFRPSQLFFKWYGQWYRSILSSFTRIFVQNQSSLHLLRNIGQTNCEATGDTRFDRVAQIAAEAKELELIKSYAGENKVIVAGSTWAPDEALLTKYLNESEDKTLKIIIAPHEVSESSLCRIEEQLNIPSLRYSNATDKDLSKYRALLIDGYGLLSSVYQYGKVSYIGGGFGVGIHNILEAATWSMPVVFGPNYLKFKEACDLVGRKGAFPVTDFSSLKQTFDRLFLDNAQLKISSEVAENYVKINTGATDRIFNAIF